MPEEGSVEHSEQIQNPPIETPLPTIDNQSPVVESPQFVERVNVPYELQLLCNKDWEDNDSLNFDGPCPRVSGPTRIRFRTAHLLDLNMDFDRISQVNTEQTLNPPRCSYSG